MEKDPWYRDGLRFQCTGCGDCCTGAPGHVWVNQQEIAALAASAGVSVEAFEKKYVRRVGVRKSLKEFPNGDCVLFNHETRRCEAYDLRPRQCRTWPFWGSNLTTPAAWNATCRDCPGAGVGRLVPLEEIQASLAKIKI